METQEGLKAFRVFYRQPQLRNLNSVVVNNCWAILSIFNEKVETDLELMTKKVQHTGAAWQVVGI